MMEVAVGTNINIMRQFGFIASYQNNYSTFLKGLRPHKLRLIFF